MFPELQKASMRLTVSNMVTRGKVPHMMPGNFGCCDADHNNRIDLIPEFVLLVWRDVLWTGDLDYAREMWTVVTESIAYALDTYDADGDGLLNSSGADQTYDQFPLKGTSAFVGFIFAASLKAAAEPARLVGDTEAEADYTRMHERAMATLDDQLWNGKGYRLSYDPRDRTGNDGIMADQINGDWFLRQTTGAGLLPLPRVRGVLREILRNCRMPEGFIANCVWPKGEPTVIGRWTADQANWPWSGVEYTLASHCALAGMGKDAIQTARDVWERYERAGLRYNHIECGGHYYRAMSSWALYLSLTGFCWNALTRTLSLAPAPNGKPTLFVTPSGWGAVTSTGRTVSVTLSAGSVTLNRLCLTGVRKAPLRAAIGKRQAELRKKATPGIVDFSAPLPLGEGDRLVVSF